MELSRRGMMGAAAAAVVAGPGYASQIGSQIGGSVPTPVGLLDAGAKDSDEREWRMSQLAKLKRLAAGDIRDEDRNYPVDGPPSPFSSLRSVSENAKHFMRNRLLERQWRERTIAQALVSLDEYDRTGILRTFF